MPRQRFVFVRLGLLIILGIALWSGIHALAQTPDTTSARITSPEGNTPLFGIVTITGTAANPALQTYKLEYQALTDPNAAWQAIGKPVAQQITDGVLGQWDTRTLADGSYQLRLRVSLRNGTVLEALIRDLRVSNQQPTPLPTLPPTASPTVLPTAGPSPTSFIAQPPTATPRPAVANPPTSAPPVNPNATAPDLSLGLSASTIQNAVCNGALLALATFIVMGAVAAIRGRSQRVRR